MNEIQISSRNSLAAIAEEIWPEANPEDIDAMVDDAKGGRAWNLEMFRAGVEIVAAEWRAHYPERAGRPYTTGAERFQRSPMLRGNRSGLGMVSPGEFAAAVLASLA